MTLRVRIAGAVCIALAAVLLAAQSAPRRRATNPFPPGTLRAVDDAYTAQRAQATSVDAAHGVLANDFGPKKLIAIQTAAPQHGFLTFLPDGSFTYTNDGTDAASDFFTYKISDGTNDSLPATVTITITTADPPVARGNTFQVANGGLLQVAAPGVLADDTDPSGLTLSAVVATNPAHGILVLSANGAFTYRHDGTSSLFDTFSYRATNGTLFSSAAPVTITIGTVAAPTVASQTYTTAQDTALGVAAPGVLTGATHDAGAQLTAIAVAQPAHGTLALSADGSFTYTPAAGYSGADSFTYQASDGTSLSSNTGVAFITIVPTAAVNPDSYAAVTGLPQSVPAAIGVLANDSPGLQIASYGAATGREQATLGTATPTAQSGSVALNADGSFTYAPPAGFAGVDTFRYVAGNAVSSNAAVVTITVNAPPVAVADSYLIARNTARTVGAPGVLANDTLNDAVLARGAGPSSGMLTLNADGSFTYTPNGGYTGLDAFGYTLTNVTGTVGGVVTLTVVAPPVATNDDYITQVNVTLVGSSVLANDNPGGTITSYGKTTGTEQATIGQPTPTNLTGAFVSMNADGTFTYTPAPGSAAVDSFRYIVGNYAGASEATVTIQFDSTSTARHRAP